MTRVFNKETGAMIPVTVIDVTGNTYGQIKTADKDGYTAIIVVLGIIQIARIFILPVKAHAATALVNGVEVAVMGDGQYMYVVGCLVASAVCCFVAAVTSAKNNKILADYMASIENHAA